MKKSIKLLSLLLVMLIGTNKVYAKDTCVYIGNDENGICVGMGEVSIYEGSAKLEEESGNYTLTLNNINITDYKRYFDKTYGIYFDEGNLTIKLEGTNTISFIDKDIPNVEEYSAIYLDDSYSLNIIGTGKLNINANGDYDLYGIHVDYINLGEEDKNGPTINGNLDAGENGMSILISGDFNIYNTDIKGNMKGALAVGIFSNTDIPCNIKNSDINLDVTTSSEGYGIFSYDKDLNIENSDILIKTHKLNDDSAEMGIVCPEKITIKDTRLVIITSGYSEDTASLFNNDSGSIEFIHTTGKHFLFVTNTLLIPENDITYTNINNEMVYVDETSLENIKLTSNFNIDNINELVNKKYIVITTGIDNEITSGNNQNLKKNNITSYSINTNHFRYLIKEIKLEDTVLNEEDYELAKDGTVTLTKTGLTKLNNLDVGTYKLKLDYYAGNDLEVNINISEEIDNPKTIDNIITYIVLGTISLINLIICILYKKNRI